MSSWSTSSQSNSSDGDLECKVRSRLIDYPVDRSSPVIQPKKWPSEPQPVTADAVYIVCSIILGIIPAVFLVLVWMAWRLDGVAVSDIAWGKRVISMALYGPSFFPILFAAIVSRTLKKVALWRLTKKHGTRIQTLEQLLGSVSMGSTIVTQFKLRGFGILAVFLATLWSLSPVGGQAALRILRIESVGTTSTIEVGYMGTYYMENNSTLGWEHKYNNLIFIMQSLLSTALMAPKDMKAASMDQWGNLKIPMFEELPDKHVDTEGWIEVPSNMNARKYSSLLGIPLANIPSTGNTRFHMESTYWTLNCPRFETVYGISPWINITTSKDFGTVNKTNIIDIPQQNKKVFRISTGNTTQAMRQRNPSNQKLLPRSILVESSDTSNKSVTTGYCNLYSSYVESAVSCANKHCDVVQMRPSQRPHKPTSFTALDIQAEQISANVNRNETEVTKFINSLAAVGHGTGEFSGSALQWYFTKPVTPYKRLDTTTDISIVGNATFAVSLAQLLNTFWLTSLAPYTLTGNETDGMMYQTYPLATLVPATHTVTADRYVCNYLWLGLLLLATWSLLLVGAVDIIVASVCSAPDVLGFFSLITRDNPYIRLPRGGSTLHGDQRALLLRNLVVKIGDVKPEQEVGVVAIAAVGREEGELGVRGVKPGRRYW